MKLQVLTIHNIASIENAVINFEAEPLAKSEVFLITGKTGAGKSTILDAICLALYANTPRLKNTNMEGESTDGNKEVKINDPRQLMRRNTGEAFVKLTFIGSNGIHYEAIWSVARARNRVDGNLQSKKWQLKNLETGHTLTKDKEITDEIQAAVGLEFKQFCRTTLLAQGEFTRFLNSQDKEKAEILEKITGVDIYSKIGKKIFEITASKQQAWEEAVKLLNNTQVLSNEEIDAYKARIDETEKCQQRLKAEYEKGDKKLKWIHTEEELKKKAAAATENLKGATEKIEDETFRRNELLVKHWNETIEPRGWLKELKNNTDIQLRLKQVLQEAGNVFNELKKGERKIQETILKTKEQYNSLSESIDRENDKENIYLNVQTLTGWLDIIVQSRNSISSESQTIEVSETKLKEELQPKKDYADKLYANAVQSYEEHATRLQKMGKILKEAKLHELRKRKEQILHDIHATEDAMEKLKILDKETKRQENKKKEIAEQEVFIDKLKKQLDELKPQIHDAELTAKIRRENLDKQRESCDDWAQSIRAKLQMGDVCPVCRQIIEQELPREEELSTWFASIEKAWKEADLLLTELKDKEKSLIADIHAHQKSHNTAKINLINDTALSDCMHAAQTACRKCSIHSMDKNTADILARMLIRIQTELDAVSKDISQADALEQTVEESRKKSDILRNLMNETRMLVEEAERNINECKNSITTSNKLIQSKKNEIETTEKKIRQLLGNTQWKYGWNSETSSFYNELKEAAQHYNDRVKLLEKLELKIKEKHTLIQNVSQAMEAIVEMMPEWKQTTQSDALPENNAESENELPEKANRLRTTIKSAIDQLNDVEKSIRELKRKLTDYSDTHGENSHEMLDELNHYTASDIAILNKGVLDVREELVTQKTIWNQIMQQQQEHTDKKPALDGDDTTDSLQISMQQIDRQINELGEKKGALSLLLKQDQDNKIKQSTLLADIEAKKRIYEQWGRINRLIGDATGSKFRKIAQSYVLSSLIHSANSYMQNLSDRYTLKVVPGTFVIMLEDAYQGYVSRAASTISGGEGFLVSLALALALSDIGQTLAVDTLFIDEGFGTLSGEPLQNAINTLRTLHTKGGRHVGIISHVEELRERIPVQIQVNQEGNNSSSTIRIV